MRISVDLAQLRRRWQSLFPYGRRLRADHRAVPVGHGARPQYSRRVQRMLTRLFR